MASGWYLPTGMNNVWDIPSEGRAPKSPITNHLRYVMFFLGLKEMILLPDFKKIEIIFRKLKFHRLH